MPYLTSLRNKFNSEKVLDVTYASKLIYLGAYELPPTLTIYPQTYKESTNLLRSFAIVQSWTKILLIGLRYAVLTGFDKMVRDIDLPI